MNRVLREDPAMKAWVNSVVGDWDKLTDKTEGMYKVLDQIIDNMPEYRQREEAELRGISADVFDWYRLNREEIKKWGEIHKEVMHNAGVDTDELKDKSKAIGQAYRLVGDQVKAFWDKAFLESFPLIEAGLRKVSEWLTWLENWNKEHPGMAMAEGIGVAVGAWKLAEATLGAVLGKMRGNFAATATAAEVEAARIAAAGKGILGPSVFALGKLALGGAAGVGAYFGAQRLMENVEKRKAATGESTLGAGAKELLLPRWEKPTEEQHKRAAEKRGELWEDIKGGAEAIKSFLGFGGGGAKPEAGGLVVGGAARPRQHGGIIGPGGELAALHQGEMVLPSSISHGLQMMIAQSGVSEDAARAQRRSSNTLIDWLMGSLVPKVKIDNADELPGGSDAEGGYGGGGARAGGGTGGGGGPGTAAGAEGAGAGGGRGRGREDAMPGEFAGTGKGKGAQLAGQSMQYFMSQGWTREQAAGIAANIERESSWNPQDVGDRGAAYGLGQWHPDRQAKFKEVFGKDIRQSSFGEQLQFIQWELMHTEKMAGGRLKAAKTAAEAGAAVSEHYERPAAREFEAASRGQTAERLMNIPLPSGGGMAGMGGGAIPRGTGGPAAAVDEMLRMQGMTEQGDRTTIAKFLKAGGMGLDPAVAAWCAAYTNAALQMHGVKGTGSAMASSFAKFGTKASPADVLKGDVLVEMRGRQPGEKGAHVGLATGETRMGRRGQLEIEMISGNQADRVMRKWYNATELLVRRSAGVMAQRQRQIEGPALPGADINYARGGVPERAVTMNVTNNTTIHPQPGEHPSTTANRYANTHKRVWNDAYRDLRPSLG
jgi:uncharacterized protein (TIGR02594 family)